MTLTPRPAPASIDETLEMLTEADYVADRSLAGPCNVAPDDVA